MGYSLAYPFVLMTCFSSGVCNMPTGDPNYIFFSTAERCQFIADQLNRGYAADRRSDQPANYMQGVCFDRDTRQPVVRAQEEAEPTNEMELDGQTAAPPEPESSFSQYMRNLENAKRQQGMR